MYLQIDERIELANEGERLTHFLHRAGCVSSIGEAKNLIKQKGITINSEPVADLMYSFQNIPVQGLRVARSRRWIRVVQPYFKDGDEVTQRLWNERVAGDAFEIDEDIEELINEGISHEDPDWTGICIHCSLEHEE